MSWLFLASALLLSCGVGCFEVHSSWWTEKWYMRMPMDHFGYSFDADVFDMRYLINQSNWKPGGPIFFYTGNEGDITMFALNTGFVWEIAPEFGAMVVFAEHRYYGKTLPYGNASYALGSNIGKLSSEQALADYAVFLTWLKKSPGASNSPVVAFGGSYGGMLAAWMRIKYPHIIVGSLASSAPILQFNGVTPCNTFADIVTRTYAVSGQDCEKKINASWPAIRRLAKTADGQKWLTSNFELCPNSTITESNVQSLVDFLNSAWSYLAMIDYPYPTNFLNPVPGWPVKVACSHLSNVSATSDDKDLLTAIMKGASVYLNYKKQVSCFAFNYTGTTSLGTDGWNYQYCTEMVMPMCQLHSSMFEYQPWDFAATKQSCQKEFHVTPRLDWAMTNYGGAHLSAASNIIFSNGLLDPWSGGSPLVSAGPNVVVFNITQGAHHLDLRGSDSKDPRQVSLVRNKERRLFRAWLQEFYAAAGMKEHLHANIRGALSRRTQRLRPKARAHGKKSLRDNERAEAELYNGDLDPWSGGGVVNQVKSLFDFGNFKTVHIFKITGGAHHLDLRSSNPGDTDSVRAVRDEEKMIIRTWVNDAAKPGAPLAIVLAISIVHFLRL